VGKEPISVPPEMEYGDTKMVLDIIRSIQEGRAIKVDDVPEYLPSYEHHEREAVEPVRL